MAPKPKLARVQRIVIPILRGHNDHTVQQSTRPDLDGVTIGSWVEDVDFRRFPLINIRRVGGGRNARRPNLFGLTTVEMTAYGTDGLVETEDVYDIALEALYEAVRKQTQTPWGYLHSAKETMGVTQFGSLFQDSWRIQGLIQLGVRPPRDK